MLSATPLPPIPVIDVPGGPPPILDGTLNDPAWKSSAALTCRSSDSGDQEADKSLTEVRVMRDGAWIYFGFSCGHPDSKRIKTSVTEDDGPVHGDESVEIFLDPSPEKGNFFHFLLNAANVRAEQRFEKTGEADRAWRIPWRSATGRTSEGWEAEVAIPLSLLSSNGILAETKMNVFRNAVIPVVDEQHVQVGSRRISEGWSRVVRSHNERDRFGKVNGLGSERVQTPFLPRIEMAESGAYELKNESYSYPLKIRLHGYSPLTGKVDVVVTDHSDTGEHHIHRETVEIPGMEDKVLEVAIPVATPAQRKTVVQIVDPQTGESLQSVLAREAGDRILLSAYLDSTYYTTERQAIAACEIGLPEAIFTKAHLRVTDSGGRELGRTAPKEKQVFLPFGIQSLPVGAQTVNVELRDANDRMLVKVSQPLVKRESKPGSEVKIDRIHRSVSKDGAAVFPFGCVLYGRNLADASQDEHVRQIAEMGFNTVFQWAFMDSAHAARYLDVCKKFGLMVVNDKTRYGGVNLIAVKGRAVGARHLARDEASRIFREAYEQALPGNLKGVAAVKDATNLLAWYSFDEPFGPEFFDMYLQGQDLYRRVNEADGYHPTYVFYPDKEVVGWADITGSDPYWVPAGEGIRGNVNYVAKITHEYNKAGAKYRMPVWMMPMAESWSGIRKRPILPEEQFCQTYLSLIHGAKGIFYFKYRPFHKMTFDALAALGKQMKVLGPFISASDVAQNITYDPVPFDPDHDRYPDVQVALFRSPDRRYVLLAANSSSHPVDAEVTIEGVGAGGTVTSLFTERTLPLEDGAFSEYLKGMETRAYLLPEGSELKEPVAVRVCSTPRTENFIAESPQLPDTGRPGKRNLVRNPGFEEATVPNWPDYHQPTADFGVNPIGMENASWVQDATQPHSGQWSLRVKDGFGDIVMLTPQHAEAKAFVFSAWLRTDQKSMKVRLSAGSDNKEVEATSDWKRHFLQVTIPARASPYFNFTIVPGGRIGTLWIDDVQVEAGETPSDFEP